ncbi:transposase, mutator type [Mycobacterium haemophilum DSM 44634]|nr:transposase [Mycobacterium haemophilum]MCV7342769.1 transposase [Mycobacterium haemophilum DSM 44634]
MSSYVMLRLRFSGSYRGGGAVYVVLIRAARAGSGARCGSSNVSAAVRVASTRVAYKSGRELRTGDEGHREKVASSMRAIYSAPIVEDAELALKDFDASYGQQYPGAIDVWRNSWPEFVWFLDYPVELPKLSTPPTRLNRSTFGCVRSLRTVAISG